MSTSISYTVTFPPGTNETESGGSAASLSATNLTNTLSTDYAGISATVTSAPSISMQPVAPQMIKINVSPQTQITPLFVGAFESIVYRIDGNIVSDGFTEPARPYTIEATFVLVDGTTVSGGSFIMKLVTIALTPVDTSIAFYDSNGNVEQDASALSMLINGESGSLTFQNTPTYPGYVTGDLFVLPAWFTTIDTTTTPISYRSRTNALDGGGLGGRAAVGTGTGNETSNEPAGITVPWKSIIDAGFAQTDQFTFFLEFELVGSSFFSSTGFNMHMTGLSATYGTWSQYGGNYYNTGWRYIGDLAAGIHYYPDIIPTSVLYHDEIANVEITADGAAYNTGEYHLQYGKTYFDPQYPKTFASTPGTWYYSMTYIPDSTGNFFVVERIYDSNKVLCVTVTSTVQSLNTGRTSFLELTCFTTETDTVTYKKFGLAADPGVITDF